MDESLKFQVAGLKWMFEMELLDDKNPAPINVLKMNVLSVSPRIREVEFLIFREGRQMLVLLDLSWIMRRFFKRKVSQISRDVQEILQQLLPNFKFRVTSDPKIMEMAVANVKKLLGGIDEIRNRKDDDSDSKSDGKPELNGSGEQPATTQAQQGANQSSPSDPQEQPETGSGLLTKSGPGDSSEQS